MKDSLFTAAELAGAAAALFASSSSERYERMARAHAARTAIAVRLSRVPDEFWKLDQSAHALARSVVAARERGPDEVALALTLALLAASGAPGTAQLLSQLGLSQAPGALWIAALARRLLRDRADTQYVMRFPARPASSFGRPRNVATAISFRVGAGLLASALSGGIVAQVQGHGASDVALWTRTRTA